MSGAIPLQRRLANLRATLGRGDLDGTIAPARSPAAGRRPGQLATRLATALDADLVTSPRGSVVVRDAPSVVIPVDRERLARLPGQPPADVKLLVLDTETTGLATAAGTLAFLVGLGWWEGDRFRQQQLLLPDHADEPALLDLLGERIAAHGWLVTYNGKGFDWPLLVARYRLGGRPAPEHGGHLDLLSLVRRMFRHRMDDARLATVETALLDVARHADVGGWEIPGIYLDVLRGGPLEPLAAVVRHNESDVRSLARLVAHLEQRYADRASRLGTPRGDLAGLARAFVRDHRDDDALECIDDALAAAPPLRDPFGRDPVRSSDPDGRGELPWWSPRVRPDYGGRGRAPGIPLATRDLAGIRWTDERLAAERARVLRRLGRLEESAEAWVAAAAGGGVLAAIAWIEVAKLREHRFADPAGAFDAVRRAWRVTEQSRGLGRPLARLEADIVRRGARLRARLARREPPVVAGAA
jgi:hypothetical protein